METKFQALFQRQCLLSLYLSFTRQVSEWLVRVLGWEGDRVRGRVDDVREVQDSELWLAPSDGILHWHEDTVALADERITFV